MNNNLVLLVIVMSAGSSSYFPQSQHPRADPVFPPRGQRPGVHRSNSLDDVGKAAKYDPDTKDIQRCSGVCVQPKECSRMGGIANRECMNGGGRVCCNCTQ